MKTLKGVIAATTGKGEVVPNESDLHMVPWYFILSSGLYAIEFEDGITPTMVEPSTDRRTVLKNFYIDDSVGVGLIAPTISRRSVLKTYRAEPETIGIGLVAPTISRKAAVRYLVYDKAEPEAIGVGLLAPAISRRNHPVYTTEEESISVGLLAPTIKRTNT